MSEQSRVENPILVERYRGQVLESFHRGVICMVDKDSKVIFQEEIFSRFAIQGPL